MLQIDIELLSKIIPRFRETLEGEGDAWEKEREEKDEFFHEYFTKERLPELEEGTLRELIHILWAYNGWTNKDYLLQEMLKSGIDGIRRSFDYLLYSSDPIAKRFDYMQRNVRMMGAASISEILTHHDHSKYPIWNRRSKAGLIALGVPRKLIPKSAQIGGTQYQAFCKLVREVRDQVVSKYPEFENLFALDFLLYYISTQESLVSSSTVEKGVPSVEPIEDFDHDAVVDQILELGDGLGFDVKDKFKVTRGCEIDAIWRTRIANLGTIAYAFEVQRRGSRDSAILNLQRTKRDPSIQKVVIVSTEKELNAFREEIASLGEDFRDSIGYFKVDDLQTALNHLYVLKGILRNLGLLTATSLFK